MKLQELTPKGGGGRFEFSFSLPADVPVLDRAPEAKIVWRVVATLLGTSSIFTPDAADSAWLLVYALPWLDAVPPPFDAHHEFDVAALGLGSVHYRADVSDTCSRVALPDRSR